MINWPAFAQQTFPCEFRYEQGIWGKVNNSSADFRWIAATPQFMRQNQTIERQYFGAQDKPRTFCAWTKQAHLYYAIGAYPSQSMDSAGRSGFLEKQFIQWPENNNIANQVAMFALVYQANQYHEQMALNNVADRLWNNQDFYLPLEAAVLTLTEKDIEALITEGINELEQCLDKEILGQFYATLLTEQYPVVLKLKEPLSAVAFACLFLPLSASLFAKLSITGWLPTARFSSSKIKKAWNVIITDQSIAHKSPLLSEDNINLGESLAQSLLDNTPDSAKSNQSFSAASLTDNPSITLWGPSASGKTFLLAQLYLQAKSDDAHNHWEVHPTSNTIDYITPFRQNIIADNIFPTGTAIGDNTELTFKFYNTENHQQVDLNIEDRAGKDYSEHHQEVTQRLMSTQGLVILVNPFDKRDVQINEVLKMLDAMKVERGEDVKDMRPLVICYTQVDEDWIDTPEALQFAIEDPNAFINSQINPNDKILARVKLHFTNYKLFPVSAAGLKLQYGTVLKTAFFNDELKACICPQGDSVNLLEPFIWIIEQLNISTDIEDTNNTENNNNTYE